MSFRRKTFATAVLASLGALALLAPAADAAPGAAWQITLRAQQTNLRPNQVATATVSQYLLTAENVGAATTSGPITASVELPDGISLASGRKPSMGDQHHITGVGSSCVEAGLTMTCTNANPIDPGEWVQMMVPVNVGDLDDPTVLDVLGTISGGGAGSATAQISTVITDTAPAFGFLPGREGLNASAVKDDGTPATQAGSHPQQVNLNLSIPTDVNVAGNNIIPNATLDDVKVDLPAGMVVDPSAADKCSEVKLVALSCPDSSQVGVVSVPLQTGAPRPTRLFNLEPPPGYAAAFGFKIADIPVHIFGGVRPGDYRITSLSPDALSILTIFAARVQLWGSPTDASHDGVRGTCGATATADATKLCPVTRQDKPLLSMPTSCTDSMRVDAHVSFWNEPGRFYDRAAEFSDSNGNTTPVTGCDLLQFEPSLRARPTSDVADSPTGLEAVLTIPQTDSLGARATAHLRKAVVTLPEGVTVNPSSANGLQGCSSGQVGIDPGTGVPDGNPVACPDASRIGTVEVDTPLLENPLPGSVYVATPHDNPFDSLLAIYVTVEDPVTDTLVKLAGHVVADSRTGRLTTTFDNNPELPFSRFKLDFFGGAYAALKTPATCGTYSTTSSLTPWSAPASGPPATPKDTWSISRGPNGGCGALGNSPAFEAGSVNPLAGSFSPFVGRLQRADGTQQFKALNLTLPPGLSGKLAGIPTCSDAQIAGAQARKHEGGGREELSSPSCPAASEVGQVTVGAGAGPSPYYTQGKIYLAGPYKGAPVSVAIVTPAVAGPYDLGNVVVRAALRIDPITAQVRVLSDPIPSILQGIPLQIRDVRVNMGRPQFTLNPTNCEPMTISGEAISVFGQAAPLSNRFQVADCAALPFKPKLAIRLKGGTRRGKNPALRATLTMPPGSANVARASVALPHSEFLDQAHIRTICTRVQFAADACPKGAIYGKARAFTPLLDEPLEGPVYMRSSSNPLPDLVAALKGPAQRPIEVVLAGRIDSVNGGIRNTYEAVPDQPVSKFVLEMQGGKKGLLVNSRDLCRLKAAKRRATAKFTGQNGKTHRIKPVLTNDCKKRKKGKRRGHRR